MVCDAALHADPGAPWKGTVEVKVIIPRGKEHFSGWVYVPNPVSKLGIISDFDDTIKITHVHHTREMIDDALMGDAATDEPVPGMAYLYREIVKGGRRVKRPVFYVTASPDALAPRIVNFLSLNGFPPGSLNLIRLDSAKKFLEGFSDYILKYNSRESSTTVRRLSAESKTRKNLLFFYRAREKNLFQLRKQFLRALLLY